MKIVLKGFIIIMGTRVIIDLSTDELIRDVIKRNNVNE